MADLPLPNDKASLIGLVEQTQFAQAGIVSRTVLAAGSLRVVLFGVSRGQELSEHATPRRALVQVLSGDCLFKFNGAWTRLTAGALLHMPPGHAHAVKADQSDCSFLLTLQETAQSGDSGTPGAA